LIIDHSSGNGLVGTGLVGKFYSRIFVDVTTRRLAGGSNLFSVSSVKASARISMTATSTWGKNPPHVEGICCPRKKTNSHS